jgi:hypothetical protein
MSTYLTIKEAAALSGKAEITVRRFVNSIVKEQPSCEERNQIEPAPSKVQALKKQKKPFSWKIEEKLITKKLMQDIALAKKSNKKNTEPREDILSTLQKELNSKEGQLKVKDKQIESLTEIVQSQNERMREGNVLMASLQKHLSLPEAGYSENAKKKSWIKKLWS